MTLKKKPTVTPAEKAAFRAFRVAQKKAGMAPDLLEVAAELKTSKQNTHHLLERLAAKGWLIKVKRYRGYREVRRTARKRAAA